MWLPWLFVLRHRVKHWTVLSVLSVGPNHADLVCGLAAQHCLRQRLRPLQCCLTLREGAKVCLTAGSILQAWLIVLVIACLDVHFKISRVIEICSMSLSFGLHTASLETVPCMIHSTGSDDTAADHHSCGALDWSVLNDALQSAHKMTYLCIGALTRD